jgi:CelD/BcsL family acetyltransferase involved in cellulose biosynthesis
MSRFRVSVEPLRDLPAAEAVWRALEPRADGSFFTSWTWVGSWLAATAVAARMLTAHEGGRVVAAGVFGSVPRGRLLLHETGNAAWDRLTVEYNDLLVARDAAEDPRPSCLAALAAQPDVRAIDLSGVDARWLAAASTAGLPVRLAHRRPTFAIRLDPADGGADAVIDRLGPNTRAALRQTLRRLGPVAGRSAASLAEAHAFLDALIALHQDAWRARGQPGAFADARVRAFHHHMVEQGWRAGTVELFAVSGPGAPFAYLLNYCHGDVVHAYQSGIADGLPKRLKPGLTAHCVCAGHHARRGRRRYDLMAGDARYKRNLGAPAGDLLWITAYASRSTAAVAGLDRLRRRITNRLRRFG